MRMFCGFVLFLVACGGSSSPSHVDADASSAPVQDASTAPDSGADAAVADSSTPPSPTGCDAGGCASLVGHVSRKSTTMAQHGGKGNVYIAVFDGNPIADQANAKVVAQTVVMNADLSGTASVAYRVDAIAVRATEYQVVAFLDDDHNADPMNPAPGKGDLVTIDLGAFGGIKASLTKPGDTTLDLQLNAALP